MAGVRASAISLSYSLGQSRGRGITPAPSVFLV